MDYTGKQVLVLGLGESGLAMALWLAQCGATVRVADTRAAPERLTVLRAALPDVTFHAGAFSAELLDQIDVVAVSPGLAPQRELAAILPAAAERAIPVWGEIELFAQALAALRTQTGYAPNVLAITGTNGKTTVTSLVGLLCERAGMTVQVAGNISPAALDVLRNALAAAALPQVWVLELSSFQLHTTHSLQADAATVLNVTQDHLDWHGDFAAYAADKARIFGPNTIRVLNRDDALVMAMASPLAPLVTFGSDEAATPDSFGLINDNGMQWLAQAVAADEPEKKRSKKHPGEAVAVSTNRLMPSDALKIRGQHNAVNTLAALALCRAIGLPLAPLLHGLRDYHGEPHRVELIATIGEVAWYDDSKGTNVGATVAALKGLGQELHGKLVLIAGGEGKGQDFSPLAAPVARHVRTVLLIGKDAAVLRAALDGDVALIDCDSLEQAVERAAAIAQPGDAVLLSPACASFDMFTSYVHRAAVFGDAVRELALARGEVVA
ncbi:UDP-N-acetylmuramoylalanine--D-glutamate ligase [Actimicrobium sp. GrIS 1.19]|uniref:UDP-N-acetylmuramoyl-L-alanine--D-glutamate ligase n=1 Tax=Actimicrobium sp. GrIS 1.19 TaxID=3071708 RepID=UPI002DFA1A20|nr:UDP-N-acetylmuramoylalanine--D-glutamate ligase [Actimicrobium sp. GrIS 1.19]